jgi:hypothetical protein
MDEFLVQRRLRRQDGFTAEGRAELLVGDAGG